MLTGIDHIVLNCKDVEYTADWYERVLRLKREVFGPENRISAQIWKSKDKSAANWCERLVVRRKRGIRLR